LKGYVVSNILKDAAEEGYKEPELAKLQKSVQKHFHKIVLEFVNDYLKK
jgi:hypothetical protein